MAGIERIRRRNERRREGDTPGGTASLRGKNGLEWRNCCGNNGALSRSPGIWNALASCRSATKRFTVMSGRIGKKAERCTDTCEARAKRAESGMDATTAGGDWRASG